MAIGGAYAGSKIRFDTARDNVQFGERLIKLVKGINFSSKESKDRLLTFAEDIKAGKTIAVNDEFIKIFDDVKVANAFLDAVSPLDEEGNRTNKSFQSADDLMDKDKFAAGMIAYFNAVDDRYKQGIDIIDRLDAERKDLKAKNTNLTAENATLVSDNKGLVEENFHLTKSGRRKNFVIATLAVTLAVVATFGTIFGIGNAKKNKTIEEKDSIIREMEGELENAKNYLKEIGYELKADETLKDGIKNLNDTMENKNATLSEQNQALEQAKATLEAANARYQDVLNKATDSTNNVFDTLKVKKPGSDETYSVADFDTLSDAIDFINTQVDDSALRQELENVKSQLEAKNQELEQANANLEQAQTKLAKAMEDLAAADEKIKELEEKNYDAGDFENQDGQSGDNVPVGSETDDNQNGGSSLDNGTGSDESELEGGNIR